VSLEIDLAAAVLVAAVLHAAWNSFVKVGHDRLASMTVIALTGGLLAAPVLALVPLPARASFGYLAGSVSTHIVYFFFLIRAYQVGDLSRVYPMARGIAPPGVAIMAAIAAGEIPSRRKIVGITLVSLGIASLLIGSAPERGTAGIEQGGRDDRAWVRLSLATGSLIALYSVVDGLGARHAGSSSSAKRVRRSGSPPRWWSQWA
jgi:multidrug transporter EmrE-like cation transporter